MVEFIYKKALKWIVVFLLIFSLVYFLVTVVFSGNKKQNYDSDLQILTLEVNAESLNLSSLTYSYGYKTTLNIQSGGSAEVYYTLSKTDYKEVIYYGSDDDNIALVSQDGLVTGVHPGTTIIYSYSTLNNDLVSNYIEVVVR